MAGEVRLWPVGFNLDAYRYLGEKVEFSIVSGFAYTGCVRNGGEYVLVFITAYPLSKSIINLSSERRTCGFAITMFSEGLDSHLYDRKEYRLD